MAPHALAADQRRAVDDADLRALADLDERFRSRRIVDGDVVKPGGLGRGALSRPHVPRQKDPEGHSNDGRYVSANPHRAGSCALRCPRRARLHDEAAGTGLVPAADGGADVRKNRFGTRGAWKVDGNRVPAPVRLLKRDLDAEPAL